MTVTVFDLKLKNFSIIGANSSSQGDAYYEGIVRFHATHEGKLQMAPQSKLTIERQGMISGELHCHELEIHGQFSGVCHSSARIIIYPGAQVSGKIYAKSIVVYPGAQVNMEGHTERTLS